MHRLRHYGPEPCLTEKGSIGDSTSFYQLTHFFPMHSFSYGFLMFSGGRERVHWERMQAWTNCAPNVDRANVDEARSIFWARTFCLKKKKKKSFDLLISSQTDKSMKKLQWIPDTIVSTSVLVLFLCLHIWWCQNWFIYSRIEKHLINCMH